MDTDMRKVACPCCGGPMAMEEVVCWACFRLTNKLTPGVYTDSDGDVCDITREDVDRYDRARERRMGW